MSSSNEQLIASAYVFGAAALAFATLPFVFGILRGLMKANEPNSSPGGIFGVFLFSFAIHTVACVAFMIAILILDNQSIKQQNHIQNCVFGIFWTDASKESNIKSALTSLCGQKSSSDSDSIIYSGSVSILYVVQTIRDWFFILLPLITLFLGIGYGVYMCKKDTYKQNNDYTSVFLWTFSSAVVAYLLFVLWASIAEIALFFKLGDDYNSVFGLIKKLYDNIINKALEIISGSSSSY